MGLTQVLCLVVFWLSTVHGVCPLDPTCSLTAGVSSTITRDNCNGVVGCKYTSPSPCAISATSNPVTDVAACDAEAACVYVGPRCNSTSKSGCNLIPGCVYAGGAGSYNDISCVPEAFNPSDCLPKAANAGTCTKVCTGGSENDCNAIAGCRWIAGSTCVPKAPALGPGTQCCATSDTSCVQYCADGFASQTMAGDCVAKFLPPAGQCSTVAQCYQLIYLWGYFGLTLISQVTNNPAGLFNWFVDHKEAVSLYCGERTNCSAMWAVPTFKDGVGTQCVQNLGTCLGFCASDPGFCGPLIQLGAITLDPTDDELGPLYQCVQNGVDCENITGGDACRNIKGCRDLVLESYNCNATFPSGSPDPGVYNPTYANYTKCKALRAKLDGCKTTPGPCGEVLKENFGPKPYIVLAFYWLAYLILTHADYHNH